MNSLIKNFKDWGLLEAAAQPATPAASVMLIRAWTDSSPVGPETTKRLGGFDKEYTITPKSGTLLQALFNFSKAGESAVLSNYVNLGNPTPVAVGTDRLTIGNKTINQKGEITVLKAEFDTPGVSVIASGNGLLALARVGFAMNKTFTRSKIDASGAANYAISFVMGGEPKEDASRKAAITYIGTGSKLYTIGNSLTCATSIALLNKGTVVTPIPTTPTVAAKSFIEAKDPYWSKYLKLVDVADPASALVKFAVNCLLNDSYMVNATPDSASATAALSSLIKQSQAVVIHPKQQGGKAIPVPVEAGSDNVALTMDGATQIKSILTSIADSVLPVSLPAGFDASAQPVLETYRQMLKAGLLQSLNGDTAIGERFNSVQSAYKWTQGEASPAVNLSLDGKVSSGEF